MRSKLLLLAVVCSLAAPGFARAIPEAVPDAPLFGQQAARGRSLITQQAAPVAPTPKTVDGNIDDWTGEITRFGGTSITSHGEFVYQDYINDAWGADDGQDAARTQYTDALNETEARAYRVEALSQALGEQFGVEGCNETVCAVAEYGDVEDRDRLENDIEEVRVAADASTVYVLVRTIGMTKPDATGVVLLIDDESPGGANPGPGGLTTRTRTWLSVGGGSVMEASNLDAEAVSVAQNPSGYTNATEIAIPRAQLPDGETLRLAVATCVASRTQCKQVRRGDAASDIVNVAFRPNEPARIWMDHDQAHALRLGSIDTFFTSVDLDRLVEGYSETFAPAPGYWERIYVTDSAVNFEGESNAYHQGIFQHYGVYLPSTFRSSPGSVYPTTWWTHYRGGHAHDAAAWVPGLLRQFGEAKGNIMIFPSARGTSSWYVGRGLEDFLNVWDDSVATFPIDPDRVYMTGYSMGGFASWFLPMVFPDRFAGASPQEGPPTQGLFAGAGPNASDPSSPQNGGDAQAQLMFNVIENARHVPYVIYHGTDDELVPISGILRMQARFVELGYRNRLYALDGNEHYTTAILDTWTEAADYLNKYRRDPNPARVTYRTWPALERAASTISTNIAGLDLGYRFNSAYWVSGLEVRDKEFLSDGKPDPAVWGTIDATTNGRGVPENLLIPEAGAGHQGTPYEMTGLSWLGNGRTASSNSFRASLNNLEAARLDTARMGISTTRTISADIQTDGATAIELAGGWSRCPRVDFGTLTGTVSCSAGAATLHIAGAGTGALTITP